MVADPSLLFLDEPTSVEYSPVGACSSPAQLCPPPPQGLDSTTSFELVSALHAMAAKGVNIITVLHQPSFPLFQKFTNVLLLGKGGRTVFLGESLLPLFPVAVP